LNPDANQFALSLMDQGYRANIFTGAEIEAIQIQVLQLLKEYILKYTHYDSSSVKEETAQSILQSIFYCINSYLMGLENHEQSIRILKTTGIKEIHRRGLELTKNQVCQARDIYQEVKSTKLEVSLTAYEDTINEGIQSFFQNYDVYFDAHNTVANIDYPLLCDDMSRTGISYIKNYLEKLKMENELCRHFSPEEINLLLKGYGQQYGFECTEMLINISELILKNALFSVLLGKRAIELTLSWGECDLIGKTLQNLTKQQCWERVQNALDNMLRELQDISPSLKTYLREFLWAFFPALYHAIEQNTLPSLLVVSQRMDPPPVLLYEAGEKLSDEQLRAVIDELQHCGDGPAKASLIMSKVRSLEDLMEILGADCLFGNEYAAVFDLLGDYEMAILVAKFFEDTTFTGTRDLFVDEWHRTANETQWLTHFVHYLTKGASDRQQKIIDLAKSLANSTG